MSTTRALGTDDSVTTCDCCGKTNLKFTVVIEQADGEIMHYGQVCATRNTGKTRPVINAEIKAHADQQRRAARAEFLAHPACIAERARFAERDEVACRTGQRMVGIPAMEFVREACEVAAEARAAIAAKYGISSCALLF